MTRLWFVRHAPTHARAMVGWSDLPADLSDAPALGRLSAHLPPGPVVSSDLARARATATGIGLRGPRLADEPGLREIHFGTWEMRSFDDVAAEDPDHIRAFWDQPGDIAPPGGESWNAFATRVDASTDRLVSAGHDDLVIVCHLGVILRQIERALGVTTTSAFSHKIDNLSVTRIDAAAEGWRSIGINHRP